MPRARLEFRPASARHIGRTRLWEVWHAAKGYLGFVGWTGRGNGRYEFHRASVLEPRRHTPYLRQITRFCRARTADQKAHRTPTLTTVGDEVVARIVARPALRRVPVSFNIQGIRVEGVAYARREEE